MSASRGVGCSRPAYRERPVWRSRFFLLGVLEKKGSRTRKGSQVKLCHRYWAFILAAAGILALPQTAHAEETNWLESAREFKERAVAHLKKAQSPDADRASEAKKALHELNAARELLKKHTDPRPAEMVKELEEVNSLIYWVSKMTPLDVAGQPDVRPPRPSPGRSREELAREYYTRAREYARRNPGNLFLCAVQFFEVADRFQGTSWAMRAMRASLDYQRRLLAGDRAGSAKTDEKIRASRVDREELISELSTILRREEFTAEEKVQACDKFLRELPRDPLGKEVQTIRAVFAARKAEGRSLAARVYLQSHPHGTFASDLADLRRVAEEEKAFERLVKVLRSGSTTADKLNALNDFLHRFKTGGRREEAAALETVFSARQQDDEVAAWLQYRTAFPEGTLKKTAETALLRAGTLVLVQIRRALAEGDETRVRDQARAYLELTRKGAAAAEVRSLLEIVGTPHGPERSRAAEKYLKAHAGGIFTGVVRGKLDEWRKADAEAAFKRVQERFAASRASAERLRVLADFLHAYPEGDRAAEARTASAVFKLPGVEARLAAARKYLSAYPGGGLVEAIRETEKQLVREREEELYRAAKRTMADRKATFGTGLSACRAYLAEFPDGARAGEVRGFEEKIRALMVEEEDVFRKLQSGLSGAASPGEGIALCDGFLRKYQGGANTPRVRMRTQALRVRASEADETREYRALKEKLQLTGTSFIAKADECLRFLRSHRQSTYRKEIREILERLTTFPVGPHAGPVRTAVFTPDSKYLVTCDADARVSGTGVWVWKLPDIELAGRYQVTPGFTVCAAAIPAEGDRIYLGEENGSVTVLDIDAGEMLGRCRLGAGTVSSVSTAADGESAIVACAGDQKVRCWDCTGWVPAGQVFKCPGGASASATSPTGGLVAVGGRDGRLLVFPDDAEEPIWSALDAHGGEIDCLAFSNSGRCLASASRADGTVSLWSAATGERLWQVEEKTESVAFAGDRMLLTGPSLRLVAGGRAVAELGGTGAAAASPDGRYAFTAGEGDRATLWYLPALLAK